MNFRISAILPLLACLTSALGAQEPADSLVRLMNAQYARMVKTEGENVREVIGPATFLHNGTFLVCDTAYWHVDAQLINAIGNVKVIQDETELSGDKLDYLIDRDMAQFRGSVVQLQDKDGNLLRSRHLDYHTKDSVAVFAHGASMRDKEGQVIESVDGTYDSKTKLFTFENEVNMFTDSVFVRTDRLLYHGESNRAEFERPVDIWRGDNMLSADRGAYDRVSEMFYFYDGVHALGDTQEAWADTLVYDRLISDIKLYGNVQLTDSLRGVSGLGRYAHYEDSLARVTLQREAAAVIMVKRSGRDADAVHDGDSLSVRPSQDTVFLGADRLVYSSVRVCDIDPAELSESVRRVEEMNADAVSQYRANAAEEAARKEEEAQRKADEASGKAAVKNAGLLGGPAGGVGGGDSSPDAAPLHDGDMSADSLAAAVPEVPSESSDSLALAAADSVAVAALPDTSAAVQAADSLAFAAADSLAVTPPDTSKVGFAYAIGDVRVFGGGIQARCDSLVYFEMDSLVRMYVEPVIWNEDGRHQYYSDSLTVLIRDGRMEKSSLRDNAFVIIQEDSTSFDQIKGTEMMAWFDSTGSMSRFDALGSATAIFYIEENDVLATVNKSESKMLSAWFVNGDMDRIYYFDAPKNSAYPAVQLPAEDRRMRGFRWEPERRPKDRGDITTVRLRESMRSMYEARPKTEFKFTDMFFPGYMAGIYGEIAYRDSLGRIVPVDTSGVAAVDSVAVVADSLARVPADTLAVHAPSDTLAVDDSTWVDVDEALSRLAASQPGRKELRRQRREARWAELDARDARRAEAKAARRQEKMLRRAAKTKAANARQAARDSVAFERYRRHYERRKAREDARAASRALRRRPTAPSAASLAVPDTVAVSGD